MNIGGVYLCHVMCCQLQVLVIGGVFHLNELLVLHLHLNLSFFFKQFNYNQL